eukprot:SAG31_NODE_3809_length_3863_cov_2.881775_1_plen_355_part_00
MYGDEQRCLRREPYWRIRESRLHDLPRCAGRRPDQVLNLVDLLNLPLSKFLVTCLSEAKRHIDWLQEQHPQLRSEQFGHTLVADDPFWVRLVSDPRLLRIAAEYIGEEIALFASHYIAKPAGDGQEVLWHQDGAYWPLEPMEVVTLWLAVDDSDSENVRFPVLLASFKHPSASLHHYYFSFFVLLLLLSLSSSASSSSSSLSSSSSSSLLLLLLLNAMRFLFVVKGCMRVLPGTHAMDLHEMVPSERESVLGSQIPNEVVDESDAVDIVLKAGDVSVHNPRIVHGSNANTSNRRRGGLTIRYIPTSTEIGSANQQACFLLQGAPVAGINNKYLPFPKFDASRHMPFKGCEKWQA